MSMPTPFQNNTAYLLTEDADAIVARCTPEGPGALAVIRISGNNALAVITPLACIASGQKLDMVPTHTVHYGTVVDPDTAFVVDQVMFIIMRAPRSFTGQDTVEITCHNNPFIVENIISLVIKQGGRAARAGEFSKRAVLAGKMDLVQAEAIHDLIFATNAQATQISLAQLQGSLSSRMGEIEGGLIDLLALVEASFEFLDEEQRDLAFDTSIIERVGRLESTVADIMQHYSYQDRVQQGVRLALMGVTNAGKSTLFNRLVGKNRSIVTDQAGTTRDSIEAVMSRYGRNLVLVDTAGIRETGDVIEQEGIQRSFYEAEQADLVLLVIDATRPTGEQLSDPQKNMLERIKHKLVVVVNKMDIEERGASYQDVAFDTVLGSMSHYAVSAQQGTGIEVLQLAMKQKIDELLARYDAPYLINARHYGLLVELSNRLKAIRHHLSNDIQYELLAYHLKEALESVGMLTGKAATEKVFDAVFSGFCVGK